MWIEVLKQVLYECVFLAAGLVLGYGVRRVLPPRPQIWRKVLFYFILFAMIQLPSWAGDENAILFFPFFMAAILLSLDGTPLARFVTGGIFYSLILSLNTMLDTVIRYIHIPGTEIAVVWNIADSLLPLVKLLMVCGLSWLICRCVPRDGIQLSQRFWTLLGGLTLAPLAATLSFSFWNNDFENKEVHNIYEEALNRLAFTILPFVFLSALALLFALTILAKHEALEQKNSLAQMRESYYQSVKQEQTQVRTLRHDLRNHLSALQGMLQRGRTEEAKRYLEKLADLPAMLGGKRYCENETANVVLASKVAIMEEEGLSSDFSLSLPGKIYLSDPELCALLGNALDNAIEAAAAADDRQILLRVKMEKGLFMLRTENGLSGTVNPDLSTTKPDAEHHGFGIPGMREIVQRYGGTLEAGVINGRFQLIACMPLPDGAKDELRFPQ